MIKKNLEITGLACLGIALGIILYWVLILIQGL